MRKQRLKAPVKFETYGVVGTYSHREKDDSDIVREIGPDGEITAHAVIRTIRMIDRLHRAKLIQDHEWRVASDLRDLWELAGIGVGFPGGMEPGRIRLSDKPDVVDEVAFRRYQRAMRALPMGLRPFLRAIVIEDRSPADCARVWPGEPMNQLSMALNILERISY